VEDSSVASGSSPVTSSRTFGAIDDITGGESCRPRPTAAVAVKTGTVSVRQRIARSTGRESRIDHGGEIDTALARLFIARFKLRMFDPPSA
jgi:hypothetical protein